MRVGLFGTRPIQACSPCLPYLPCTFNPNLLDWPGWPSYLRSNTGRTEDNQGYKNSIRQTQLCKHKHFNIMEPFVARVITFRKHLGVHGHIRGQGDMSIRDRVVHSGRGWYIRNRVVHQRQDCTFRDRVEKSGTGRNVKRQGDTCWCMSLSADQTTSYIFN